MENKEFFEEELCEAVELVSMLEKLSASTSADEFPVAGVQLTLAQIRKKLLSLMAQWTRVKWSSSTKACL